MSKTWNLPTAGLALAMAALLLTPTSTALGTSLLPDPAPDWLACLIGGGLILAYAVYKRYYDLPPPQVPGCQS